MDPSKDFIGDDLSGIDFSLDDLNGVNLSETTLTDANFIGAKNVELALFEGADITGAKVTAEQYNAMKAAGATGTPLIIQPEGGQAAAVRPAQDSIRPGQKASAQAKGPGGLR